MRTSSCIATLCGLGTIGKMPGTLGSLAALPFAWAMLHWAGMEVLLGATLAVSLIGWWASAVYVRVTGRKDPKEVIIDEVAGQWLTVALFALAIDFSSLPEMAFYALSFLAFRAADILKPWPVSLLDRHVPGGLGVMLDDLAAAVWMVGFVCAGLYVLA